MASVPRKLGQHVLGEDIRHQAHGLVRVQGHAVGADDPGGLLSAMLQRVQAQVSELLRLRVRIDRHHPALFAKFVGSQHLAISL